MTTMNCKGRRDKKEKKKAVSNTSSHERRHTTPHVEGDV
jgi:hypothetical protein